MKKTPKKSYIIFTNISENPEKFVKMQKRQVAFNMYTKDIPILIAYVGISAIKQTSFMAF